MRKTLATICLALSALLAHAADARALQSGGGPAAPRAQSNPDLEEAARLNAEVLKLFREGKYEEAYPLARRVLELREKAAGPDAPLVAYALNNLASIYVQRGKGSDAEPLYRRALAIVGKQPGGADTDFAANLNMELGLIRTSERDYKGASPLLQTALSAKERLHGKDDAALLSTLFALTDVNFLSGDVEGARQTLGRALDILLKQPAKKDEATLSRLKSYMCPLYGQRREDDKELYPKLSHAMSRLENPERAAELERAAKEREALGVTENGAIAGGVLNGHAVSKPAPDYPAAAKMQRVSGTVVVQLVVDEAGKVIEAEAICGHPALRRAAEDAARGARFTPTTLAGKPVKVSGVITYNFVLR